MGWIGIDLSGSGEELHCMVMLLMHVYFNFRSMSGGRCWLLAQILWCQVVG
jgi:hypothetical protein